MCKKLFKELPISVAKKRIKEWSICLRTKFFDTVELAQATLNKYASQDTTRQQHPKLYHLHNGQSKRVRTFDYCRTSKKREHASSVCPLKQLSIVTGAVLTHHRAQKRLP
jgi:hypothetical protein